MCPLEICLEVSHSTYEIMYSLYIAEMYRAGTFLSPQLVWVRVYLNDFCSAGSRKSYIG